MSDVDRSDCRRTSGEDPSPHILERLFISRAAEPYAGALTYFRRRFKCLGEGRHRVVFAGRNGLDVIKVPWNDMGALANEFELSPGSWLGDPSRYAKTWHDTRYSRLLGVLAIRMERLSLQVPSYRELPAWCRNVDSFQVGYNAARRLVAYDWG